jgi:hypothetical protein
MYPRYDNVLGERRMRKGGTDVGWRLRADLHHDRDPSGLPFGRHPQCPQGDCGGTSACRLRLRAGSAGRSRDRKSMRPARRSCGPIDLWSSVTWFECWWPVAGGNPASAGRVSEELTKRPAPQAPCEWRLRVVPEGRKCPAVTRRICPVIPRHAKGALRPPIRPRGFIRRAAVSVASDMNGQEGSRPQRWGTATDEEQTFEG